MASAERAAAPAAKPPLKAGDHLFLVDGSGYIFRAYHALPPLNRKSDGLPVGAVLGFCNMVWKLMQDARNTERRRRPTHFAVIFDYSSKTFRNELYAEYKANRSAPPEDLIPQFGLIREATRAFNLPCIEMEGFEADDLIATYARLACEAGADTTIISSDKDLMQLVGPTVTMYDPMKDRQIGVAEVVREMGRAAGKDDRPAGADRRFRRQRAGRSGHRAEDGGAAARRVRRPRHAARPRRRDQAGRSAARTIIDNRRQGAHFARAGASSDDDVPVDRAGSTISRCSRPTGRS